MLNPVVLVDPDGRQVDSPDGEYYDFLTGKKVHDDGIDDGKVYIRKKVVESAGSMGITYKNEDKYIGQKDQIPDKTEIFKETLKNTEAFFNEQNEKFKAAEEQILFGYLGKFNRRKDAFRKLVTDNSEYDIKNSKKSPFYAGKGNQNYFKNYAFYDGKLLRSDDFGNFNYGVAGKAFGFGNFILEFAAGMNQLSKSNVPHHIKAYGDDIKDNYMINLGIKYHSSNF